ncbi:MAG: histidine kinase [Panacibacter sp.]
MESQYYYWAVGAYRTWFGLNAPVKSGSSFLGALEIVGSLNTEGGFAIAIKFAKMFAVKQKEATLLSREKEHLKAKSDSRVYEEVKPTFLFNVLNRLYSRVQETKIDAGDSIKKINDLILYTSYDAKKTLLPLVRELESLKEYIELEKVSYNYAVQADCNIKGSTVNKLIAPYILIPVAEYSFTHIGNGTVQHAWLNIEINIEGNELRATFTSSKSSETSTLLGDKNINIALIEQRLQVLYPGGYHLKKIIEPEKLVIELYINLSMRLGI